MKRKTFVILLIISVFSSHILAARQQHQHENKRKSTFVIQGTVKNMEMDPVENAVVLMPVPGVSVKTGESGGFEISGLNPGKYHIEVYAENHMDFISDSFHLKKDILDFEIILTKAITESVVVTATRTPKIYAEVPVRTEIITRRDIKQKQARNLAESLSLTTGIRVETNCHSCNFTQVRINGMEGKYSQILINNSPLFSSMVGVYGLEQIPSGMVDRIEIVKGGGSSLYGGNAVAGVINVITKEPQSNQTSVEVHQESIAGNPYTNIGFRTSLISEDGNTRGLLFADYKNRAPADFNEDQFSEVGLLKNTSFGIKFSNHFPRLNSKLRVGFFRINEERRGGDLFEKPPHEANLAEWIKSDLVEFSAEWDHYLRENLFYNLSASFLDAQRDSYYGTDKDLNAYGNTENPVLFLNGQVNFQAASHLLTLGAQFKKENIKDRALGYDRMIDDEYGEIGIFFQDDIKLSDTFSLLAGVRLSGHTLMDRLLMHPRMSLLTNLTSNISWRTSFSTGFRAPQIFDEDLHITQVGGEGMIIQNSPELKEESSYSFSSGFDFGKIVGQKQFQFSLEGFFTLLQDSFTLFKQENGTIENALVFERINGSDSKVYGVSLDFGYQQGNWFSFRAGWTFQKNQRDEPEPDFNSKYFFRTPESYGYAQISYTNSKLANLELSLQYTGNMKVPHYQGYIPEDRLETTSPFLVVNSKLNRPVPITSSYDIILFAGIDNLFNSYQPDLDKGMSRDSGYVYGPEKPRSFYAGLEFSF